MHLYTYIKYALYTCAPFLPLGIRQDPHLIGFGVIDQDESSSDDDLQREQTNTTKERPAAETWLQM